jgi:hypothetical protein
MARRFAFESLWSDENFTVQKGVVTGKTTLSGSDLGQGIIYYPVSANLNHRIAGSIHVEYPAIASGGLSSLWNPGLEAEIENRNDSPTDIFRVAIKYSPQLVEDLTEEQIGLATRLLLHGDWAEAFKSSVKVDLDAIRLLVPRFGGPTREDILRAAIAKQDLELKLAWFSSETVRLGTTFYAFQIGSLSKVPGTGPPGLITVTVNTKDPTTSSLVNGCVVWANLALYGHSTANAVSFPCLSTPTADSLPVAIHNMWAEKGGKQGNQRQISIIRSAHSSSSQLVDLEAP